jgi:hypothetical protein
MKFTSVNRVLVSSSLAVAAMAATAARASVLLYEPFNYSGSTLDGKSGAFGTTGSYAEWNPTNTPVAGPLRLGSSSLSYPAGTTLVSSGGSVTDGTATTQDGDYIPLATPINLANPGTYYISFLAESISRTSSQSYLGVDLNAGETAPRSAVDIHFGWGSSGSIRTGGDPQSGSSLTNTIVTSSSPALTLSTTYMLIGKIVDTGGSVTTYLTAYPSTGSVPATEPTSWNVTSLTTLTSATYTNLQIRKGTNLSVVVDEVLIGTTYADVTQAQPVPEPSATLAGGAVAAAAAMRRRRRA